MSRVGNHTWLMPTLLNAIIAIHKYKKCIRAKSCRGISYLRKHCLKKNQNAPKPSEHPPVRGKKMSKRLGGMKAANTKPLHGI